MQHIAQLRPVAWIVPNHSPAPQDATGQALPHVLHSVDRASSLSDMSDAQREVQIIHEGRAVEYHMAKYAETSDLGELGAAHGARLRMESLIRGRSPAQVARMERERGLA